MAWEWPSETTTMTGWKIYTSLHTAETSCITITGTECLRMYRYKPESQGADGLPAQRGLTLMATGCLIWLCFVTSTGILTTSTVASIEKVTVHTAIQILFMRLRHWCITTMGKGISQKSRKNLVLRFQARD